MKILVLAYQISPYRGSEYSVAWNYVSNMSKEHDLVILYGASGNHMGDTSELEDYTQVNDMDNVKFIAVKPSKYTRILNILNRKGVFSYTFYFAYHQWQKKVYKQARTFTNNENFDLIHFLNPIGYREPGYLWKINLPYVWGPIGGATHPPLCLFRALYLKSKIKIGFRTLINYIQLSFNPNLKTALINTDVLLTATSENKRIIKEKFNIDSIYLPENGITGDIIKNINIGNDKFCRLIWIGSIDERKALINLFRSMIQIEDDILKNIKLNIVGDGYLRGKLEKFAKKNKISDSIIWHGKINRSEVELLLENSDLHIITSIGEGNPTTVWEAMKVGVPTITLDNCGMHDTICENCGVKIPIYNYNQVINDLANAISDLSLNRSKIKILSKGVTECAEKYKWSSRIPFFNDIYKLAIEKWNEKKQK